MFVIVILCVVMLLVLLLAAYVVLLSDKTVLVYGGVPVVIWNIPTFQCHSHKINFTQLARKYGITQNVGDQFRGDKITILYDPGNFPALLYTNHSRLQMRNGGLPQFGNLTLHLNYFRRSVDYQIPDPNFEGIAVIDFESWRPIFRQNFGILAHYKDLSLKAERTAHPFWSEKLIEREASDNFQFYARQFMEDTLMVAQQMRPQASWGYYAYPYCFNMSPKNMHRHCPIEVHNENTQIASWLFSRTDNLHPSIYLSSNKRLTLRQNVDMVVGRIQEAQRILNTLRPKESYTRRILPYLWYKYRDTKEFLLKDHLNAVLEAISKYNVDGLILWGSSNDVNSKTNCMKLYDYIDFVLGPAVSYETNDIDQQ